MEKTNERRGTGWIGIPKLLSRLIALVLVVPAFTGCEPEINLESESFIKYIGGSSVDRGVAIQELSGSGFVVLATSASWDGGQAKMVALFLDEFGNLQNVELFEEEVAWDMVRSEDDFILLGGKATGSGDWDLAVTRISNSGQIVNRFEVLVPGSDEVDGKINVSEDLITISAQSWSGDRISGIIARASMDGSEIDVVHYLSPAEGIDVTAVQSAHIGDGVVINAGSIARDDASGEDIYLLSAPGQIDQVWQLQLPGDQQAVTMVNSSIGDYWILGNDFNSGLPRPFLGTWEANSLSLVTSSLGHVSLGTNPFEARAGYPTADGGMIIVGQSSDQDVVLVKVTDSKTVAWEKEISGLGPESANAVVTTRDGGYAIAGTREIDGVETIFILKTKNDGTF